MASTLWTTESGGRPPSFLLSDIDPRETTMRVPICDAASNSASMRPSTPLGNT